MNLFVRRQLNGPRLEAQRPQGRVNSGGLKNNGESVEEGVHLLFVTKRLELLTCWTILVATGPAKKQILHG